MEADLMALKSSLEINFVELLKTQDKVAGSILIAIREDLPSKFKALQINICTSVESRYGELVVVEDVEDVEFLDQEE